MILLDTHIWLWWLLGDGNLKQRERDLLDDFASLKNLCISWVSLWETEMLERKNRITLLPDFKSWILQATDDSYLTILPVDLDVVLMQRFLPESFHTDPADRLITATAILSGFHLATFDSRIIESGLCNIWDGAARF